MAAYSTPVSHMNSFPLPALAAAIAAVIALPFSAAAAGTLLLTAALGAIIHADYAQRCQRVRLPRLAVAHIRRTQAPFAYREPHQLAA
jgi:hypothetical protein